MVRYATQPASIPDYRFSKKVRPDSFRRLHNNKRLTHFCHDNRGSLINKTAGRFNLYPTAVYLGISDKRKAGKRPAGIAGTNGKLCRSGRSRVNGTFPCVRVPSTC